MSLTLDEVRNIKFRMAKRSGYEVLDVDEFVDQVEASFEQLLDENANLKRQVESLKATANTGQAPAQPRPAAQPAPTATAQAPSGEKIVVTTAGEASSAVVRLVQMSTEQAENLVAEAETEARKIKSDAQRTAKQLTTDANTRAERVESEARVNAERIRSEAHNQVDRLNRDAEDRRREMFGELEKQRDQLAASVTQLRKFEADYRQNLTNELRGHIDSLSGGRAEPPSAPAVLNELGQNGNSTANSTANSAANRQPAQSQSSASDTPRLDALLGEQR
jgi:DivIVA domain-containing protein